MTPRSRSPRLRSWLRLESLEDRSVPSTFQVTNTLDAGPGSLRQAVLSANAHPGADEIKFKHSAEGTITLLSELGVTGDLTVHGPGADDLTVSGGGTTRVLNVAAGVRVKIDGLTIANGKVTGGVGGGILNAGTLTLDRSVVTGNTAVRSGPPSFAGGRGGGIENTGTLTVNRSTVTGNSATTDGGGIHSTGSGVVVLDRSTVSDNTCSGDGAGIRSEVGTTLTLTDSTVSGNSASGFGTGGIASGAKMTIADSTIRNNTSAAAGIYLMGFSNGGEVLISRSVIRDNGPNATSGSGVGGVWSRSSNKIRIEDSVVRNNKGSTAGGLFGSGKWEVVDSTISGNTATFGGGGLFVFGSLAMTRSTVSGNTGGTGGMLTSGPTTVAESTISGNTGVSTGGISGSQLDLVRSTVSGNTANPATGSTGVGGVAITNGHIQNSTISGNTVIADQMQVYHSYYGFDIGDATGGVVRAGLNGSSASVDNSTIAFNTVTNAPAGIRTSGGLAVQPPHTITYNGYYGTYTYDFSGEAHVRNTVIARNESNIGGPDVAGAFTSGGHNLIGVLTADATGFVATDLKGTAAHPLDPKLKPLADNGGPTKTHALAAGSPALNAGDNMAAPATDQRGRDRVVGGVIDIGAYEARRGDEDDHDDHDDHDDRRSSASVWIAPDLTTNGQNFGATEAADRPVAVGWPSPLGRFQFPSLHLPTFWFDPFDHTDAGLVT